MTALLPPPAPSEYSSSSAKHLSACTRTRSAHHRGSALKQARRRLPTCPIVCFSDWVCGSTLALLPFLVLCRLKRLPTLRPSCRSAAACSYRYVL
jgi:hypothetical protein